jgi:hypothetical protein
VALTLSNYDKFFAITASDTNNFAVVPDAIYIGGAGNLVAVMPDGTTVTFTGVLAGTVLPISCIRVNASSTTATALVGLKQV